MAKKEKQKDLPGMEDRKLPDLHAAAEGYAETRDERMKLTKTEVEQKAKLLELMEKHGIEVKIRREKKEEE